MADLLLAYTLPTFVYVLFILSHSLFASVGFKKSLFDLSPRLKPFYRLLFNLLSVIIIIIWLLTLPEDQHLYRITGVLFYLMIFIQLTAGFFFIKALFTNSGSVLLGLSQILNYLRHGKLPRFLDEPEAGKLNRKGLYKYMRHPTYTFAAFFLIASPLMTINLLYLIFMILLYFGIGTVFEERNLIHRFGDEYRNYQNEVPRFIPDIFDIFRDKISDKSV